MNSESDPSGSPDPTADESHSHRPLDLPGNPRIIPRDGHRISRDQISPGALKVLYRLHNKGFKGYLVGGGVRDLYLGKTPKDFDIGTDARPSRLKKIFKNCRIIGRRFRIAHIYFPDEDIIEVATFRQGEVAAVQKKDSVILLDNQYGSAEDDANRRDLTINGLFYDIGTFSIIDYVGGVQDLEDRIVRMIKPPDVSFQEDPVRMIRALRHAARTGFTVEPETLEGIVRNREEIAKTNTSRLVEELFKDLKSGAAVGFFEKAIDTGLLECILPALSAQLAEYRGEHPFLSRLRVLDEKIAEHGPDRYTNAVLLSVLLHTVLIPGPESWIGQDRHPRNIWKQLQDGYTDIGENLRVSRRDQERISQILLAHRKLIQFFRKGEMAPSYQRKTYLSEALDFLEIDLLARGEPVDIIPGWRESYVRMLVAPAKSRGWRYRRRRPHRRGRGGSGTDRERAPREGGAGQGGDGPPSPAASSPSGERPRGKKKTSKKKAKSRARGGKKRRARSRRGGGRSGGESS